MRLMELEAKLVKYELGPPEEYWPKGRPHLHYVASVAEAHGVQMLCPRCYLDNNGNVGTHWVGCWFVGRVPDDATPGPGRWNPEGSDLHDLTFVPPGMTSVQITGGCKAHFFVEQGVIRFT